MSDTLGSVISKVQQRVGTLPDYFMLQDAVVNKYRDVQARIPWTWRRRQGDMFFYAPITTGTATVLRGQNLVTFSSPIMTPALLGRQVRVAGNDTPIRTLTGMLDTTHATLDRSWSAIDQTAKGFEIYQAYVTVPDDFESFLTIVDLTRGYQLDHWGHTADELDRIDARRAYAGNTAYWMVLKDYSSDRRGVVGGVIQARGTGNAPASGGTYTGVANALFTIEITGAATFKWKKDGGVAIVGMAMDPAGNAQVLQDGVQVAFPPVAYSVGDVFSISCQASDTPGSPRYEAWPHIKADETRPYLYLANLLDLTDLGAQLPRFVRGDLLMELVLADIASWKNPDNGYYDLKLAGWHTAKAGELLFDMMRADQSRESTDLTYHDWNELPVYDGDFMVNHDLGLAYADSF